MSNWIKISDRLPKDNTVVLTYGCGVADTEICQAFYSKSKWQELDCCGDFFDYLPTHWMPLPLPPKD